MNGIKIPVAGIYKYPKIVELLSGTNTKQYKIFFCTFGTHCFFFFSISIVFVFFIW